MQVLELYSGIGGMHMAFQESGLEGDIRAAIEINTTANLIYRHNFPETKLFNLNIEGLTTEMISKLKVDTILMSPPCQPFTRNGKQCDIKDSRTDSFQHILSLLPNLSFIKNILIENVKGFEKSEMRTMLLNSLKENSFNYQEFILSPTQFGIPNSRHRYYCLAKKMPDHFLFDPKDIVMESFPERERSEDTVCFKIQDILDDDPDLNEYLLSDKILKKRLAILDISFKNSRRSCCFTKAYGRFIEGTGSVFTENSENEVAEKLKILRQKKNDTDDYLKLAQSLNLRFFTPKEISRLMCFPETFSFPSDITARQKYMVLGNSINVKVVAELIKILN